jgi:protein TonB
MRSFLLLSIFFHGAILSLLFQWKISLVEPLWPRSVIEVSLIVLKEENPLLRLGARAPSPKRDEPPVKPVSAKKIAEEKIEASALPPKPPPPVEGRKPETFSTPLATFQRPEPEPLEKIKEGNPEERPWAPEGKMPESEEGSAYVSNGEIWGGAGFDRKASGSPGGDGRSGEFPAVAASHGPGIFPGGRQGPGESKGQGLGQGSSAPGQQSKAQPSFAAEDETLLLILRKIEAAKRYPRVAQRMGIEGKTVIRFKVRPNGSIETAEILESSGFEILDQASLETVRRAAPLPYREGWLKVGITFKML